MNMRGVEESDAASPGMLTGASRFELGAAVRVLMTGATGVVAARSEPCVGEVYMLTGLTGKWFEPFELDPV